MKKYKWDKGSGLMKWDNDRWIQVFQLVNTYSSNKFRDFCGEILVKQLNKIEMEKVKNENNK